MGTSLVESHWSDHFSTQNLFYKWCSIYGMFIESDFWTWRTQNIRKGIRITTTQDIQEDSLVRELTLVQQCAVQLFSKEHIYIVHSTAFK